MIFVTVGTDTHDFSRLVRKMDDIALRKDVVMQIGNTRYKPKHARWFHFEKNHVIDSLYKKTEVIVTHAGAGSIIRSLGQGKVPVVVPRLKKYREHINNHQLDLARALSKKKRIIVVTDMEHLEMHLTKRKFLPKKNGMLLKRLNKYLEGL